jgi:hypothetical protein
VGRTKCATVFDIKEPPKGRVRNLSFSYKSFAQKTTPLQRK